MDKNMLNNSDTDILREAFESSSDPVIVVVREKIVLVNPAFTKITAWPAEEVVGKNFTEFTMDTAPMKNYIKGLTRKKTVAFYPAEIRGKDKPIKINICSTKIIVKGQYGRLVILKMD